MAQNPISALLEGLFSTSKKLYAEILKDRNLDYKNVIENYVHKKGRPLALHLKQEVGEMLYTYFVNKSIEDLTFSVDELVELSKIKSYFDLSDADTMRIRYNTGKSAINRLSEMIVSDKKITEDEIAHIYSFGLSLFVDKEYIGKILKEMALTAYHASLLVAQEDKVITREEAIHLKKLQDDLKLSDTDLGPMKQASQPTE